MEPIGLLSRREKEVVSLLLQGKRNKQIALALGVSERTVEFHLKNIYTKWQVSSRVEFILKLGKITGNDTENLWEPTVDIVDKNVDNGKQPIPQNKWVQSLKQTVFIIQKEFAMAKKILLEDVGNFLRRHWLVFTLLLLLTVSFMIRYLIIDFGLYFWLSYSLLGLFLGIGSISFGLSWSGIVDRKISFRPLPIVLTVLLPIVVAIVDCIFRYTVAKIMGPVSITIAGISNKIMWIVPPDGNSYLYTEHLVMTDNLWLMATLCIVLLFLIGVLSSKWLKRKDLVSA